MIHQNLSTLRKLMLLKGATGGSKAIEAISTGNPLAFLTDIARPLKSLLIPFTPQQEGTGDPSPSNIRSILPWDGLTVFGGGANLVNDAEITYNRAQKIDGVYENTETDTRTQFLCAVQLYDKNKTFIKNVSDGYASIGRKSVTFNVDASNCAYICLMHTGAQRNLIELFMPFIYPLGSYTLSFDVLGNDPKTVGGIKVKNIQLESGSSATAYEPYHTITDTDIVFPSAVYGGELEAVSGKLMDAFKSVDLGNKSWSLRGENTSRQVWETFCDDAVFSGTQQAGFSANAYCSEFAITTSNGLWTPGKFAPAKEGARNVFIFVVPAGSYASAAECKTAMAGIQLVYELATPQEIQLTPAQITALVGNNTIWSDADGQMTAVYLKKG